MTAGLFSDFESERLRIRMGVASRWQAQGGTISSKNEGAEMTKSAEPDVTKVGPKGYIHGWIHVGPGSSDAIRETARNLPSGPGSAQAGKILHDTADRIDQGLGDSAAARLKTAASLLSEDGGSEQMNAAREIRAHARAIKQHLKTAQSEDAPVTTPAQHASALEHIMREFPSLPPDIQRSLADYDARVASGELQFTGNFATEQQDQAGGWIQSNVARHTHLYAGGPNPG